MCRRTRPWAHDTVIREPDPWPSCTNIRHADWRGSRVGDFGESLVLVIERKPFRPPPRRRRILEEMIQEFERARFGIPECRALEGVLFAGVLQQYGLPV